MDELAQSGIRRLRDEFGVCLDPVEDLAVIRNIVDLADKVVSAGTDWQTRALLNPAIRVGGVVLKRVSIGAQEFLAHCVSPWFDDNPYILNLSLAFCMAHRGEPGMIWGYADAGPKAWEKAVRRWSRALAVDYDTLLTALVAFQETAEDNLAALVPDPITRPTSAPSPESSVSKWGPLVEMLCHEYGKTPEAWVWETAMEDVELLIERAIARKDEERRIAAQSAAKAGKGGKRAFASDPDSPKAIWLRRFTLYVEQVGKERRAK